MLIVHAGNRIDVTGRPNARFPPSQVDHVARRVGRLLDALSPSGVVSAPAAGADLVVLDEAVRRDIPIHVVIPIEPERFVRASVAEQGGAWLDRYRAVIEHASSDPASTVWEVAANGAADARDGGVGHEDDVGGEDGNEHWFLDAHDDLLARAAELAGDETLIALTIRPPGGESPPSATDDFADRAGRAGLVVLCIDPRPDADNGIIA